MSIHECQEKYTSILKHPPSTATNKTRRVSYITVESNPASGVTVVIQYDNCFGTTGPRYGNALQQSVSTLAKLGEFNIYHSFQQTISHAVNNKTSKIAGFEAAT